MDREYDLDLGNDHWLQFWSWNASISEDGKFNKGTPAHGAIVVHKKSDGTMCEGSVTWEPGHQPDGRTWSIEGEPGDHMTLTPSLLCPCGDHGYIRNGKWVVA